MSDEDLLKVFRSSEKQSKNVLANEFSDEELLNRFKNAETQIVQDGAPENLGEDISQSADDFGTAFDYGANELAWGGQKNLVAGARGVSDFIRDTDIIPDSIQEMAGNFSDYLTNDIAKTERHMQRKRDEFTPAKERSPVSTFFGRAAPLAPLGSSNMLKNAFLGGASNALNYRPGELEPFSDFAWGYGTSLAGDALFRGAAGVRNPRRRRSSAISEEKMKLMSDLERRGFKFLPSEQTGSTTLANMENAMEQMTFAKNVKTATREHNQKAVRKIMAESIGESGEITLEGMQRARSRVGEYMDRVERLTKIGFDDIFPLDVLSTNMPDRAMKKFDIELDKVLNSISENGNMSGKNYQSHISELSKVVKKAMKNGKPEARPLLELKNAMERNLLRNIDLEDAVNFSNARKTNKNINMLANDVVSPVGDVDMGKFRREYARSFKNRMTKPAEDDLSLVAHMNRQWPEGGGVSPVEARQFLQRTTRDPLSVITDVPLAPASLLYEKSAMPMYNLFGRMMENHPIAGYTGGLLGRQGAKE